MKSILYIWKGPYPWDIRVDKITGALSGNYSVTILSRWKEGQKREETINDVKIIRVGFTDPKLFSTPLSFNPIWIFAIDDAIRKIKADLVIVREIMLAEAAAFCAGKHKIPVVMDMAENYPAAMKLWKKYQETIPRKLAVHYFKIPELFEKRAVKKMDRIFTVCSENSQRISDLYGYPYDKTTVVHNTPVISNYYDIRIGSSKPPVVFGHHGYMTAEKNLDNLIKGFALAAQKNQDIILYLAGTGECYNELTQLADSFSCRDRIIFAGEYNQSELKSILSRIDIGVIPYSVNEFNNNTIHNKVFDFLACGKPVLLSNTKPFRRLIEETRSGIIVDCSKPENIANAILSLLETELINYSIHGLKSAYNLYNWSCDKNNLINFLESISDNDNK